MSQFVEFDPFLAFGGTVARRGFVSQGSGVCRLTCARSEVQIAVVDGAVDHCGLVPRSSSHGER